MRCRMVTGEMAEALAMAWDRWAFMVPLELASAAKLRRVGYSDRGERGFDWLLWALGAAAGKERKGKERVWKALFEMMDSWA